MKSIGRLAGGEQAAALLEGQAIWQHLTGYNRYPLPLLH